MEALLEISALSEAHKIDAFTCGRLEEMDRWFRESSLKHHEARFTRVFVLTGQEKEILGFFTLSGYCLEVSTLKATDGKSYKNKHSVPAHYLGRLAVAESFQGMQVGQVLIMAMFKKYAQILELTTSNFLCLDAHNDELAKYYESYGFKRAKSVVREGDPIPMYLKSSAIIRAVEDFEHQ